MGKPRARYCQLKVLSQPYHNCGRWKLSFVSRPSPLQTKAKDCQTSPAFQCTVARAHLKRWLHQQRVEPRTKILCLLLFIFKSWLCVPSFFRDIKHVVTLCRDFWGPGYWLKHRRDVRQVLGTAYPWQMFQGLTTLGETCYPKSVSSPGAVIIWEQSPGTWFPSPKSSAPSAVSWRHGWEDQKVSLASSTL